MPDALLLDWEGCIVDTAAMRQAAAQRALQEEGLTAGDAAAIDDVLAGIVAARASRAFAERLGKGFLLMDGARELLEAAQVTSRVAVVTRATRSETEFVLRLAALDSVVSSIVTADDELDAWPSPSVLKLSLAVIISSCIFSPGRTPTTGCSHSGPIAIATSVDGLRSARAAMLRTVALSAPAHVALEADGAVDSLRGLTLPVLARIAGTPAAEHST